MAGIDIDIENNNSNNTNPNNSNNNNGYTNVNGDGSTTTTVNNNSIFTKKSVIEPQQVGKYSIIDPADIISHDVFYCQMIFILGFVFLIPWFFSSFYIFNTQSGTIKKLGFASICLFTLYSFIFAILYWSFRNYYS